MQTYFEQIKSRLRAAGNPEHSIQQMNYMKNHFEFFGCKMQVWTATTRQFTSEFGWPTEADLKPIVRLCFAADQRELHYFGLKLVEKQLKKAEKDLIFFLEELILTKSWWDSVDWISKLVAIFFQKYPDLIEPTVARWMASGELWLVRVCLTFQRTYRLKTDEKMMFDCILAVRGSKEFFLQKGAGWALREHSKWNPTAVRHFLDTTEGLAPLTRREGGRLMR